MDAHLPASMARLDMPELGDVLGMSLRQAERQLDEAPAREPVLNATHADTRRFPPPDWALPTFAEAASGAGKTYTPYRGDDGVRTKVADHVERVLGVPSAGESDIIVTPGTQGALFVALASVLSPGDTVVLPDPEYLATERMLRYFGATVRRVPIVTPDSGRPTLDWDAFDAACAEGPRLMVFSHPNNPSGAIYDLETVARIARAAQERDMVVIADQLYCRLVYGAERYDNIAALPGMAERTVTLLGPSKTESLSGYRLGVAAGPRSLIDRMEDVQSCTALRAPAYAQHLLAHWLVDDDSFLANRVKEYQALLDTTVTVLNDSGVLRVRPAWGTAYVFPEVLVDVGDQELALRLKQDAGLIVNPGYQFGLAGLGHLRLCFAQDEAIWDAALGRLVDVVRSFDGR